MKTAIEYLKPIIGRNSWNSNLVKVQYTAEKHIGTWLLMLLLLATSCYETTKKLPKLDSASSDGSIHNSTSNNEPLPTYVSLPDTYQGVWVYEAYINALQATQSTKKAAEMGVGDFYNITANHAIMRMTIHEGGADNRLLMTTKTQGRIYSADTADAYGQVEFADGYLLVEGRKYRQAPTGENGLLELVHSTFIAGHYQWEGQAVELQANGTIIGMDSLQAYELNMDYNDAGMQLDKVYLTFQAAEQPLPYIYDMSGDTLHISEMVCKTFEGDLCLEIEKGPARYQLIKQ